MNVLAACVSLLILLFLLREIRSRPYSRVQEANVATSPRPNNAHNLTVDCGHLDVLDKVIRQCQRDIDHLATYGYPWIPWGSQSNSRNNPNVTHRNTTLSDALDSLNHLCYIYDRSPICLEQNGIAPGITA